MSNPQAEPAGNAGVKSREPHVLIAKNDAILPAGAGPLEFDWVIEQLRSDPAVSDLREIVPRTFTLQSTGPSMVQTVIAASLPEEMAAELERHPQVVLEDDHLLQPQPSPGASVTDPGLVSPFGTSGSWQLKLVGPDGAPVSEATVYLYGQGIPAQGRTNSSGMITLSLMNETDDTIRALYVNPLRDYWSLWVNDPQVVSGSVNTIRLRPLSESFPSFPGKQLLGWGQEAMRLGAVPAAMDGRNIRVAVIDSGAASLTHMDLGSITRGVDLTGAGAWTDDTIAHGSHCSGVIAGADGPGGVRGFAPAVEMHEARIFPGGRVSSLIDAVDYCIDQQIDVVNMSLGTGGTSQIMLQKLAQAREQGVACIVAAGNSGNAVQFPGSSPDVLTVAAIGRNGEFPDDSYHAQQRWSQGSLDGGYFAAAFSCHGPQIDVCGPGVAIVSSVPDNGFAAWDGTSMATPHVAGLAALVLAHHPDFQTPALRLRTAARVDRLFEILKESAGPLAFGDPERSGAGLPDCLRALGLDGATPPVSEPPAAVTNGAIRAGLDQIRQELIAVGLLPAQSLSPLSTVAPSSALGPNIGVVALRREIASARAQLTAAGLLTESL